MIKGMRLDERRRQGGRPNLLDGVVLRENRTGQSRGFFFSNEEKILKSSPWVGEGWIPHLKHWSKKKAGSRHFSFACSIETLYRWHDLSLLSFALILYKTSCISLQQILNR